MFSSKKEIQRNQGVDFSYDKIEKMNENNEINRTRTFF